MATQKQARGQFYTVCSDYILKDMPLPSLSAKCVIEPFAGKGDLLSWLTKNKCELPIQAYDIEPKRDDIIERDTLTNPPDYTDSWVITNPPYLAKNKSTEKAIFEKYNTNDLYKCFMLSLCERPCVGGIVIIPVGFFLSPREMDVRCRKEFLQLYRVTTIRYFEEDVFPDTTITVVACAFERSDQQLVSQSIEWTMLPKGEKRTFVMEERYNWVIGGDIYHVSVNPAIHIRRWIQDQPLLAGEQQTRLTIHALDTGKKDGRIYLNYDPNYVYEGTQASRSWATLCIKGRNLTEEEQKKIMKQFNEWLEEKRAETWSLFLPQFRESKEYARKRIPFELVYHMVGHLVNQL